MEERLNWFFSNDPRVNKDIMDDLDRRLAELDRLMEENKRYVKESQQ